MKRKKGHYWIQNEKGEILIGLWFPVNKHFEIMGRTKKLKESDLRRINEKEIEYDYTILNQPTLKQIKKIIL